MKNTLSVKSKNLIFKMLIVFTVSFSVALAFIARPKSSIAVADKRNPDDVKMEWEFTKIIINERARIKAFPPSAARDAYLIRTDEIGSKRMVTLEEYGEIQDLGAAADLEGIRAVLIAQGFDI